jgi:hypothetical protein
MTWLAEPSRAETDHRSVDHPSRCDGTDGTRNGMAIGPRHFRPIHQREPPIRSNSLSLGVSRKHRTTTTPLTTQRFHGLVVMFHVPRVISHIAIQVTRIRYPCQKRNHYRIFFSRYRISFVADFPHAGTYARIRE